MTLLTEKAVYHPERAYEILSGFAPQTFKDAIVELNEKQTICKKTGDAERSIPQRGGRLSERFINLIKGDFPSHFFHQARDFKRSLAVGSAEISETVSSGAISLAFDLMASRRATLICSADSGRIPFFNPLLDPEKLVTLKLENTQAQLELNVQRGIPVLGPYKLPLSEHTMAETHDNMSIDDPYDEAYIVIDTTVSPSKAKVTKMVYAAICAAGKMGITGASLSKQFDPSAVYETLDILCRTPHPNRGIHIVTHIGYRSLAFVAHRFMASWTISTNVLARTDKNMPVEKRIDKCDFVVAYLWNDINGNKSVCVWKVDLFLDSIAENLHGDCHVLDRVPTGCLSGMYFLFYASPRSMDISRQYSVQPNYNIL